VRIQNQKSVPSCAIRALTCRFHFSSCSQTKYIGKWFKYAGESADNSTIISYGKAGNKRWKLTILTAKPTDVEEVCEQVYLKESKSYRETAASAMAVFGQNVKK
jgi:hypothetical protein